MRCAGLGLVQRGDGCLFDCPGCVDCVTSVRYFSTYPYASSEATRDGELLARLVAEVLVALNVREAP